MRFIKKYYILFIKNRSRGFKKTPRGAIFKCVYGKATYKMRFIRKKNGKLKNHHKFDDKFGGHQKLVEKLRNVKNT